MLFRSRILTGLAAWLAAIACAAAAQKSAEKSVDELLAEARTAFAQGKTDAALELAGRAIELDPKNPRSAFVRGQIYESLGRHEPALADFDRVLQLDPRHADAYDHRGSEQFKLGRIADSIADFDKAIELDPARERGHWKRGISYYYAGKYRLGRKQFESYQTFDDNDVENAVWRYLCMARGESADKARRELLKIKDDRRVPMMQVYAMFAGKTRPENVLAAARAGDPTDEELNRRLFYAELYLGLYFDATGDRQQAAEHIAAAVEHRVEHYMWDVARIHAELLKSQAIGTPKKS